MTDWKTRALRKERVGTVDGMPFLRDRDTVTVEEADAFMAGAEACINDWRKAWDKLLAEKKEAEAKLAAAVAANNDWRKAWDEQKARIAELEAELRRLRGADGC
jgi:chromosome segregation ATPase